MSVTDDKKSEPGVYFSRIISQNNSCAATHKMKQAIKSKLKRVLDRGTFKVVDCDEILVEAIVLPGRLVLALESHVGTVKCMARIVIGGQQDPMKLFIVQQFRNFQSSTIWLVPA